MDRFLVFVVICSLGGAYAGVVRRNAPSTPPQQIDSFNGLVALVTQYMPDITSLNQPSQSTGSGSQFNANAANGGGLESLFRGLSSDNGQTMNYDLSATMQMMNQSYGMPVSSSKNASSMTREQLLEDVKRQSNVFNNMINSEMIMMLEPDRLVKFLNLTNLAYDPTIVNSTEGRQALVRQYEALTTDFQNKFQEKINGEKSNRSTGPDSSTISLESLQKQMAAMASMYNGELSQAMKPNKIAGAIGSEKEMNGMSQNVGKAIMNIFQSISQGSGPSNTPLRWDSTKTK